MGSDPRMDPRIVELFEPVGMAGPPPPCPHDITSSTEDIQKWSVEAEAGYSQLFEAMYKDAPAPKVPVERSEETIKGAGGQDMKLFIHRPEGATDRLPCVYHIHGGGIVLCPHFLDRLEEVRIFSLLGHNSFAATLEHLCGGGYSGRDGGAYALHHQIS